MGATLLLNTGEALRPSGRRILVTGAAERAVLATLRGLASAGFEVTAVGDSWLAPGLWSRAAGARRVAPDVGTNLEGYLARLESLVRDGGYEVLLAGTDASLLAISAHRDRLTPHVRLGLPAHEIVAGALDKRVLARSAAAAGLAVPEERVCEASAEALAAAQELGYPVAVKPAETAIERDGAVTRRASRLARDVTQLERVAQGLGTCIVQRWLMGPVVSVGGVATADGVAASVVSRYERMWPATGGNVAFSETIDPPPGLIPRVEALVRGLDWTGMFELELIESATHGFAAIDFNPRPYGSMSLANAAGVCLPALWCRSLLGEELSPGAAARPGVRYRWEDADLRYAGAALRDRRWNAALAAIRPRPHVTHAYFQLRDPAPGFVRALQLASLARERARQDSDGAAPAGGGGDGAASASRGSGRPRRSSTR